MAEKKYDAIVVGSGATGSIAVKELTERGLNVVLLEAGPYLEEKDFPPPPGSLPGWSTFTSLPGSCRELNATARGRVSC